MDVSRKVNAAGAGRLIRFGILLCAVLAGQAQAAPAMVDSGPHATSRLARQVWLRFSDDIVALGDDRVPDAANVTCEGTSEAPKGHWLDGKRWVAEFAQPLADGVACEVKPLALQTLKGEPVEVAAPWRFDTGGPQVRVQGKSGLYGTLKEEPVLALFSSAPLDTDTLHYLACSVNGKSKQAVILAGEARALALQRILGQNWNHDASATMLALQCGAAQWPADAKIHVHWDARIASAAHVLNKDDQSFDLKVRPPFGGRFNCHQMLATQDCDPRAPQQMPLSLVFSEQISAEAADGIRLVDEKGSAIAPQRWNNKVPVQELDFHGDFTPGQQLRLQLPPDLKDLDGRPIANGAALAMPFRLTTLPPYVGMPQHGGVLAWKPGQSAAWPVVTRNLESEVTVAAWHFTGAGSDDATLLRLLAKGRAGSSGADSIWDADSEAFAASRRVIAQLSVQAGRQPGGQLGAKMPPMQHMLLHPAGPGPSFTPLPLAGSGVWLIEVDSPTWRALAVHQRQLLQKQFADRPVALGQWSDSRFAVVQLTNLRAEALTSSQGDSLIWVTAIDSGEPVADAQVDLWAAHAGNPEKLWSGTSDAQGRVVVPAAIKWNRVYSQAQMMVVRHGDDILLADAATGGLADDRPLVHSMQDRVLLHPGETVSFQHLARSLTRDGFAVPDLGGDWTLQIISGNNYSNDKPVYEQKIAWSDDGSADSSWKIPATAKLGHYSVRLVRQDKAHGLTRFEQQDFQVEEFRTPSFEAELQGGTQWKGKAQDVEYRGALSYLSGGAAAGQEVTIKGSYTVGAASPVKGYSFYDDPPNELKLPVFTPIKLTLDEHGHASGREPAPNFDWPLTLEAEMSFADPNGEIKSETADEITVWPGRHKIGLAFERDSDDAPIKAKLIALDEKDRPLAKEALTLDFIDGKGQSRRVCEVKTDVQGMAECKLGVRRSELGEAKAVLKAEEVSPLSLIIGNHLPWIAGNGKRAPDMLDVQERRPLLGPALPVHVHAPFLPATMLLTVERQGVQRSLVRKITQADEVVELPTGAADAPMVGLRAVMVPCTGAKDAAGQIWQGGAAQYQRNVMFAEASGGLKITVKPAHAEALPGSIVSVSLKVAQADSGKPVPHAHVTIAAVDDALLAMKSNSSWDLLEAYWRRSWIDVLSTDSDALAVSAGKFGDAEHYFPPLEWALERTWVPIGVDAQFGSMERSEQLRGGMDATLGYIQTTPAPAAAMAPVADRNVGLLAGRVEVTGSNIRRADTEDHGKPRSNFSTLALWRTDLVTDERGEATVSVPMPDTLTRWYIAAIATSGAGRFGLDHGNVVTSLPVQILSGLPQSVRSGDVLVQKLTLRNTTAKPLALALEALAKGTRDDNLPGARDPMPDASLEARGLKFQRRYRLAAGENKVVEWKVSVPEGLSSLEWRIALRDQAGRKLDALVQTQTVTAAVPVTVREASLLMVDGPQQMSVAQPAGARPGQGGVAVRWQNSLVEAAMDGTRRMMAQYPYTCMEQLGSKAVVSGDPEEWNKLMAKLPAMLDTNGLVRYFAETPGSEVLTAYLLDIAEAYGLAVPQAEEARMRAGLRAALAQEVSAQEAEWLDARARLSRRLALQATLSPDLGATAPYIPLELDKLPTISLVDWLRFVLKQPESARRSAWLEAASEQLRSRYDMQGTRLTLRHNPNDTFWWFMWNNDVADSRAALMIERHLQEQPRWQGLVPGLIAGLADHQHEGHWRTTVANAWAGAAMMEFAKHAERGPVSGTSVATFGGAEARAAWPDPAPALLRWPQQGAQDKLALRHEGSGAPWATVQVMAAVDTPAPVSHGLSVQKTIEPLEQKIKGRWSVGDILRVKLVMQSDAKLTWLAVRDPIPSGATIQGKGLKGETQVGHPDGWLWWWRPSSAELGNESYRGYYQFIWSGTWEASYVVRLNNAGTFTLPPTRIEAMYAPEIFGETPNDVMEVGP